MNIKAIAGFTVGTILAFAALNLIFIGTGAAWAGVIFVGGVLGLGIGFAVNRGFEQNPLLGGTVLMAAIWLAFMLVVLFSGHALTLAYSAQGLVSMAAVGAVGGCGYKLLSR